LQNMVMKQLSQRKIFSLKAASMNRETNPEPGSGSWKLRKASSQAFQ
jgi:hypothetical protein